MSRANVSAIIPNALAILSFVIYAAAVLSLEQERAFPFVVEQDGPLPAVASHWLLRAPLGFEDSGLHQFFVKGLSSNDYSASAYSVVEQAFHGAATPAHDLSISRNGTGIGGPIATELSFLLFGPHARALPKFFLLLLGIATVCFAARFRGERLSALPIVLLALTLLLITPLSVHPQIAFQIPIGGMRYYAMIGVIPALHWCFEFSQTDTDRASTLNLSVQWTLLVVQTAILGLAILVRSSPIYLLIPVMASALMAWRSGDSMRERRLTLMRLVIPVVALVIGVQILPPVAFSDYAKAGRLFQNVWHRLFLGLGVHPGWPFPDLRENYTCPLFGGHLGPSTGDPNAYCVWWDYGRRHGMSDATLSAKLYDPDYEAALRTAFFDAVRAHPREALATFFYYKPKLTLEQIGLSLRPEWPGARPTVWVLAALQIMLVIAFIRAQPPPAPFRDAGRRVGVLALFLIPSLIPQWIVWTLPWTAIDLFVFVLCGCIIALWPAVSYGVRMLAPSAVAACAQLQGPGVSTLNDRGPNAGPDPEPIR